MILNEINNYEEKIAKEEKYSEFAFFVGVVYVMFFGFAFIHSLSSADKTSSFVLFAMLILGLLSIYWFSVFLADSKKFAKEVFKAWRQSEKMWGDAKEKFDKEKNAEFEIMSKKVKGDIVKFVIFFFSTALLSLKIDWLTVFHNMAEWLHNLGAIFVGIFS